MTLRTTFVAAVLGLGAAVFSGCSMYSPGGSGSSDDTYTYHSVPHQPTTVAVVDTRTSQTIWTYEIPVNKQLTITFYEDQYRGDDQSARLHWREYEIGTTQGRLTSQIAVPDRGNRRIDVFVRPHPEYPRASGQADRGR